VQDPSVTGYTIRIPATSPDQEKMKDKEKMMISGPTKGKREEDFHLKIDYCVDSMYLHLLIYLLHREDKVHHYYYFVL